MVILIERNNRERGRTSSGTIDNHVDCSQPRGELTDCPVY